MTNSNGTEDNAHMPSTTTSPSAILHACGSCGEPEERQPCLTCVKCDILFHYKCTKIPPYELIKYVKKQYKRKYICKHCTISTHTDELNTLTETMQMFDGQELLLNDYKKRLSVALRGKEDLMIATTTYEKKLTEHEDTIRQLQAKWQEIQQESEKVEDRKEEKKHRESREFAEFAEEIRTMKNMIFELNDKVNHTQRQKYQQHQQQEREQYETINKAIPICYVCGRAGHVARNCRNNIINRPPHRQGYPQRYNYMYMYNRSHNNKQQYHHHNNRPYNNRQHYNYNNDQQNNAQFRQYWNPSQPSYPYHNQYYMPSPSNNWFRPPTSMPSIVPCF